MESYFRESTSNTPEINFDPVEGVLMFQGKATPENAAVLFADVFYKLVEFAQSEFRSLKVVFDFESINTACSKCIFDMMKSIGEICDMGKNISVIWFFDEENELMLETGIDLEEMMFIPDFRVMRNCTVMI